MPRLDLAQSDTERSLRMAPSRPLSKADAKSTSAIAIEGNLRRVGSSSPSSLARGLHKATTVCRPVTLAWFCCLTTALTCCTPDADGAESSGKHPKPAKDPVANEGANHDAGDAGNPADGSTAHDAGPRGSVEIGIPGGPDGLDFAPLADGSELRLQTFGQGGTHVLLGIRGVGFGNRAYTNITLHNLRTGSTLESPAPPRPQLYYCDDDFVVCDLVPITVMASGIVKSGEERDGLPIEIEVEVHNEAGVHATATKRATLSTADL